MPVIFFKVSKFLLYLAPFAVVVVTPSTLFPFIVGKYTFFKVIIELALVAFALGWGFAPGGLQTLNFGLRTKKEAPSGSMLLQPLVVAVTAFVAIFTLAGFAGVNPSASFWSNFERGEGSFLMLHFLAFFLLLSLLFIKEEDWKNLFRATTGSGVLVILYGVMAAQGVFGFVGNGWCERFAGSLGNPAYIGTFSIFMLFYVAYLLASGNWKSTYWQTWVLPLLVFLALYFFAFLLLSQTRGGFLGLGVGLIAGFIYLALTFPSRKWRRVALGIATLIVLLGALGIYYRQYIDLAPWCGAGGGNRILDVSLGGETINTRFALWQQAIEAWKERPILGWGPENFSIAFEKYYNPIHKVWFDRAHNIFFDYLVFAGILGLLSLVGIFLVFYWQFFSNKIPLTDADLESNADLRRQKEYQNKKQGSQLLVPNYQLRLQEALLFALPIAYLVQGLVLFDVLPIYINLFLFLAFASWKLSPRTNF